MARSLSIILHLIPFLAFTSGQDFSVPSTWRKYSNDRPLDERISIAEAGIDRMNTNALKSDDWTYSGLGFWQSGNVYSAMANEDYYAGTQKYRNTVLQNLNKVFVATSFDKEKFNDDALWWATSSYYAWRAYNDGTALDNAKAVWDRVNTYVITQQVADSGRISTKSFSVMGTCEGQTMVGAVFWRPIIDEQSVNSITTGLFATLSAYLAEATSDSKYKDAALASVKWIKNVNTQSNYLVKDSINGHDCSRSNDWIFTYNSGKMIEALTVLYDITKDEQWNTLLQNIVVAATKNSPWQGTDGIITEGAATDKNDDANGFKSILIRALTEVYRRTSIRDMNILVHSYIDVQYNALLDISSKGDLYSNNWPAAFPGSDFLSWGQLSALDVLVGAVKAN